MNMYKLAYERYARIEIIKILGDSLIKGQRRIYLIHTILDLVIIYFMLFLVIFLAIKLHAIICFWVLLLTPFFALLSGAAFNWINVQIHEASHYLLLPKRVLNDVYCNLFFGTLGLQNLESYGATHAMHHSFLNTNRDPDLHIYDNSLDFYKALIHDLFLISAFQRKKEVKKVFN